MSHLFLTTCLCNFNSVRAHMLWRVLVHRCESHYRPIDTAWAGITERKVSICRVPSFLNAPLSTDSHKHTRWLQPRVLDLLTVCAHGFLIHSTSNIICGMSVALTTIFSRCPVCRAPIPGWNGKGGGVYGLRPRFVYEALPRSK